MNVKDKYYLNFAGLKEHQTVVGKPLEKLYKSLMQDLIVLFDQEKPACDPYKESRELFVGIKQTFPNFMPALTPREVDNLSDEEIDKIFKRIKKYNF